VVKLPLLVHEKRITDYGGRGNVGAENRLITKFLRDKKIESDTPGRLATAHGFRDWHTRWLWRNGRWRIR